MAANEIYVDLDGGTINNLINWRHNPLSTSERTSLGVTLNASNVGLFVFDTTLLQGFYWSGTAWVGEGISSVAWGGITGTLSNQTDLQNVLNLKANISNLSEVAFTGNYNDLIDKPSFISNADDGLTLDGDTVILGGTTLTDKVIDMSINGNQFWFKTKLEDDGGFYRVIIGDLDTDPWNSHSGLLISKSENDDGNRCNFLTMTTGDVSLNGWFFINYQDVTGECLPNLRVVSNASAGNAAAFNLDLAGRDSHSDFSQFSVFYYDYDEYVVSGNQAGPMLNSNLITFVNGSGGTPSTAVSFFWVDKNYNWMIGKNGFADRPLGALQIGDNSATYGIYQKGAASANWLAGNLTIGGSPNVAVNALEVVGDAKISALAGTGTTMVVADSTGLLHTQSIPTSPVQSVSNSDGSLIISPTTGAVVASLNLAHGNTFTVPQAININATGLVTAFDIDYNIPAASTNVLIARFVGQNNLGTGNRNAFIKFGVGGADSAYWDWVNDGEGGMYWAYGNDSVNLNTAGVLYMLYDGRISMKGPVGMGAFGYFAPASAVLALSSTTQGFLPPVMTTTQKNAIAGPATGLIVYDNVLNKLSIYNGAIWETYNTVTSVFGRIGDVVLTGGDVTGALGFTPYNASNPAGYVNAAGAAAAAPVQSVAGKTGTVTLVKADVGLSNVDNTSDLNKPISTATQTALNTKLSQAQIMTRISIGF